METRVVRSNRLNGESTARSQAEATALCLPAAENRQVPERGV